MLQKTVLLLALVAQVLMLENGLLRTPPMGWLAWERFRCNINCDQDPKNCISERLFMEMADRLAQDGWRDLGYVYLNIDDCWIGGRDARGRLMPDPNRFPHGIAFLADYAHSLGLKLGIYEDMGKMTCMGYPGTTLDKVELDAETFAEWKVDMLKLDGCFSTDKERAEGYPKMAAALNATGRPIAFSCSWPAYEGGLPPKVNYTLLANICNLWRNYDDIQDSWKSVLSIVDWFVKHQDILQPVAGPGHWNDPDMTGSHYVTMESWLAWNTQICASTSSAGIKGIRRHTWSRWPRSLISSLPQSCHLEMRIMTEATALVVVTCILTMNWLVVLESRVSVVPQLWLWRRVADGRCRNSSSSP